MAMGCVWDVGQIRPMTDHDFSLILEQCPRAEWFGLQVNSRCFSADIVRVCAIQSGIPYGVYLERRFCVPGIDAFTEMMFAAPTPGG